MEIYDHPILDIVNKKVNPNFTSADFFDMWAVYLATQGKFYAQFNNPILPTELYFLYPHNVKPIPHKKDFVSAFEYRIGDETHLIRREQMLWSKFNDPLDAYNGMSPIRALARTVDTENEAIDWNKNSLQNNAVPPGAINITNPSPDIQETIKRDWLQRYSGKNNVRIPIILNSEKASYTNFGLSPVDMDYLNMRKMNRVEVCSAFGVPSQVVGDPEGQTYANYEEALKAFWENTIIPRYLNSMKDRLNSELVSKYADNLKLDYNLDDIQVLHESLDSISERMIRLFTNNIISHNEARIALGYDEIKQGNTFYLELASNYLTDGIVTPTGINTGKGKLRDKERDTDTVKDKEKEKQGQNDKVSTSKPVDKPRPKQKPT
jgi:HK97 family phage portal protein